MSNHTRASVVQEIDATTMLTEQTVNLNYCKQRATFAHKDSCEFIFFCGWPQQLERAQMLYDMRNFGCTEEFAKAMKFAIDSGARWAMFYTKN